MVFLVLAAFLPPLAAALFMPVPLPQSDTLDYLAYARSIHVAGTYAATPAGPGADKRPGREPLYPLLVAGAAELSPPLARSLDQCEDPTVESCRTGFRPLIFLNALLLGGAALLAGLTVRALGGGWWGALIGTLYVAANLHMYKDMKYVLSDYLAVFLCAALTAALAHRKWTGAGFAAAALALTKAVFLPFGLLLSAVLAWRGERRAGALIAALVLVVNIGWMDRNIALFGVAGDGRDGLALSTREVFDHMSPAEHRAAWLWWLRGPGAGLARKNLPPEAWERHDWDAEDGFYQEGQLLQPGRIVAELMKTGAHDQIAAEAGVKTVVARRMLADWPNYLATLPVLFYRGIWFDEFVAVGLPLLLFVLWRSARAGAWDRLIALAPGVWSLLVYPAISLNIPRYQYTAVMALGLAAGLAADRLTRRYRPHTGSIGPAPEQTAAILSSAR